MIGLPAADLLDGALSPVAAGAGPSRLDPAEGAGGGGAGDGRLVADPLRRRLVLVAGPALGLVNLAMVWVATTLQTGSRPGAEALLWTFVAAASWSPMLFFALRWSERRPIVEGELRARLAWHLARALLLSLAAAVAVYLLRLVAHRTLGAQPFPWSAFWATYVGAWCLGDLLTYSIVVTGVSVAAAQRRLRHREVAAARLETTLARTESQLLRAQLDPHFVFNALNTIAGLIHIDPERADRVLCGLSDFLRTSLRNAGLEEVTLAEEVRHLSTYLEIQRTRFPTRFAFEVSIEEEALGALVPNLMLQPMVENIVKHAVAKDERPVRGWLAARRVADELVVVVEDDGPGPGPGRVREGVGVAGTRSRLAKLCGEGASLRLEARAGGGTLVESRIPWKTTGSEPL